MSSRQVCALKLRAYGAPCSTASSLIQFGFESSYQTQVLSTPEALQVSMDVFQAVVSNSAAGVFVSTMRSPQLISHIKN